jgi:hypothetical protein
MNKKFYEDAIRDYAKKHRIRLLYPDPNPGRNKGGQCRRTVWLGEYDDGEELAAAFFHEVGHIRDERTKTGRNHRVTRFEHELRAWVFGFERMHVFGIDATKRMHRYLTRCLESYNREENQ